MDADKRGSEQETLILNARLEDAGVRLDAFLASHIEGWSRARLQRRIENEDVLVNGKVAKSSYKLREADEVEVELVAPPTDGFTPENIPLDIVYEDDTLVVVNKPAGLVVHPAAGTPSGTLANALAYHFQQLPGTGARPGIVIASIEIHRDCWLSRRLKPRSRICLISFAIGLFTSLTSRWSMGACFRTQERSISRWRVIVRTGRAWRSCVAAEMR